MVHNHLLRPKSASSSYPHQSPIYGEKSPFWVHVWSKMEMFWASNCHQSGGNRRSSPSCVDWHCLRASQMLGLAQNMDFFDHFDPDMSTLQDTQCCTNQWVWALPGAPKPCIVLPINCARQAASIAVGFGWFVVHSDLLWPESASSPYPYQSPIYGAKGPF